VLIDVFGMLMRVLVGYNHLHKFHYVQYKLYNLTVDVLYIYIARITLYIIIISRHHIRYIQVQ